MTEQKATGSIVKGNIVNESTSIGGKNGKASSKIVVGRVAFVKAARGQINIKTKGISGSYIPKKFDSFRAKYFNAAESCGRGIIGEHYVGGIMNRKISVETRNAAISDSEPTVISRMYTCSITWIRAHYPKWPCCFCKSCERTN